MRSQSQQKGIISLNLLISLAAVVCIVYLGFKITPVYFEHNKVRLAQENVAQQVDATHKTRRQLEQEILKRLLIDDVEGLGPKHIVITKAGGQWQLRVVYTRTIMLLEKVDLLVKFDETVSVPR